MKYSADAAAYIQCFQNGTGCDTSLLEENSKFTENSAKSVQPGASIDVYEVFVLQDENEITIESSDCVSFSDDKDVQKITLK
ncbi:DUF5067 domain-containing protein [Brotonthovivens ammoniilytica]|uniref:DUF5067 domain-containing protein n=1 Tax=Brotonthovivens ammoniilytica TaxID=2981725 RepID=UPI00130D79E9